MASKKNVNYCQTTQDERNTIRIKRQILYLYNCTRTHKSIQERVIWPHHLSIHAETWYSGALTLLLIQQNKEDKEIRILDLEIIPLVDNQMNC